MRRFRVYLCHGYAQCPDEEEFVELPDNATDEEVEKECKATWETLISNMDSGWYEVEKE